MLRVMTFNLRFENKSDGENGWEYRKSAVVSLIKKYSPDICGTQEGKPSQLAYLDKNLLDYTRVCPKRPENPDAQYPTLYIKKDVLTPCFGREFWLSETPDRYMSKSWGSAFPRMLSYAMFQDKEGRRFYAAVCHLDHIGSTARVKQAGMIADWVKSCKDPVVLTGDFNDEPGSEVYRILTRPETGLFDTWMMAKMPEDQKSYTHHDFSGMPIAARMDWILATRHFMVLAVKVVRDNTDGRYPSDHFPYMADLDWVEE